MNSITAALAENEFRSHSLIRQHTWFRTEVESALLQSVQVVGHFAGIMPNRHSSRFEFPQRSVQRITDQLNDSAPIVRQIQLQRPAVRHRTGRY